MVEVLGLSASNVEALSETLIRKLVGGVGSCWFFGLIFSYLTWRCRRSHDAAFIGWVIGVIAAFAFEPLFLLFHYVFFPQGNFLFDPATSNLVRLYPDWYWEGITVRVGVSFLAGALALAALAHLRLGRLLA